MSSSKDGRRTQGDQTVVAPFYLLKKLANWWLVVGDASSRQLLVIKRVTVTKNLPVKLKSSLPKGSHSLKLYIICDSYVGADHDMTLDPIDVAEGEDSDRDEDMDSDKTYCTIKYFCNTPSMSLYLCNSFMLFNSFSAMDSIFIPPLESTIRIGR